MTYKQKNLLFGICVVLALFMYICKVPWVSNAASSIINATQVDTPTVVWTDTNLDNRIENLQERVDTLNVSLYDYWGNFKIDTAQK